MGERRTERRGRVLRVVVGADDVGSGWVPVLLLAAIPVLVVVHVPALVLGAAVLVVAVVLGGLGAITSVTLARALVRGDADRLTAAALPEMAAPGGVPRHRSGLTHPRAFAAAPRTRAGGTGHVRSRPPSTSWPVDDRVRGW